MNEAAKAFLTVEAFAGVAGCAAIVWFIVNGMRVIIGFYRKWVFVVESFLVVCVAQAITWDQLSLARVLLIVANTFLLAFAASGAQETFAHGATTPTGKAYSGRRYRWFESWFT